MTPRPPDPHGDLQTGPAEDWKPNAHHLRKIKVWSAFLETIGLPKYKADAIAFELWKLGQKVDTDRL